MIYIIESDLRDKYSDEALDTFWRFLIDEFPQCIIDSWIKENNKTYKFICKMQRISLIDELIENYLENTLKYFIQSHDPGENVERYFEIGKFGLSGNLSYDQLSRVLFQNSTSKSGVWLHDSHKKFVFKDDLVSATNRKDVNYIIGIIAKLNAHRGKYINSRENNGKKTIKPFLNSVDACFFHLLFGNEKEYRKLIDHFRSDTAYFAPTRELFVFLDDLKDIYNQFSEEMSYDHPDKSEIDEINYRLHYYKSIIALHLPIALTDIEKCLDEVLSDSEVRIRQIVDVAVEETLSQPKIDKELYYAGPIVWLAESCRCLYRESMEYLLSLLRQYEISIIEISRLWSKACDWGKVFEYIHSALYIIESVYYDYSLDEAEDRMDGAKRIDWISTEIPTGIWPENTRGYRRVRGILKYEIIETVIYD